MGHPVRACNLNSPVPVGPSIYLHSAGADSYPHQDSLSEGGKREDFLEGEEMGIHCPQSAVYRLCRLFRQCSTPHKEAAGRVDLDPRGVAGGHRGQEDGCRISRGGGSIGPDRQQNLG